MLSPTGSWEIRFDTVGNGKWGKPRKTGNIKRPHLGVDLLCNPGQSILAPFDLLSVYQAWPYRDDARYTGIRFTTTWCNGLMWYVNPLNEVLLSISIPKGGLIGFAQDISTKYGPACKTHLHFQIDCVDPIVMKGLDV